MPSFPPQLIDAVFLLLTGLVKLFVDGLLDQQSITTPGDLKASPVINIGGTDHAGRGFDGTIDDVRIYSKELTPLEVSDLALGLIGLPPNGN